MKFMKTNRGFMNMTMKMTMCMRSWGNPVLDIYGLRQDFCNGF